VANMPWKTNSEEEQRWGFVRQAMRATMGLAELCRRSGISRKTAYKWVARFQERGRRGLGDQVRSAHRLHNRPPPKWLARVRRGKSQHPNWGAPKLRWVLRKRFGPVGLPSEAAAAAAKAARPAKPKVAPEVRDKAGPTGAGSSWADPGCR